MRALGRGVIGFLALLFFAVAIFEVKRLVTGKVKPEVGVIVFAMAACGGGACAYGVWRLGQRAPASAQVIRAAQDHGGRITAAQAVAATSLSYQDACSELDRLHKAGACELLPGGNIYRFAEFEKP